MNDEPTPVRRRRSFDEKESDLNRCKHFTTLGRSGRTAARGVNYDCSPWTLGLSRREVGVEGEKERKKGAVVVFSIPYR